MCTKLLPASEPHHCTNICLNMFIFYFDEIFATFLSRWSKNIHKFVFIINLYWYAADHMALELHIVEPIDARVNYHGCYELDECCKEFFSIRQIEFHVCFFPLWKCNAFYSIKCVWLYFVKNMYYFIEKCIHISINNLTR